ncbi:hypothetical protein C8F04DRAFT_1178027 [Mycena alexandri]|uniref:Uncharacterized protein n=1 Tax=Mycena alexandri TaxID=1745969 RepID=A0AAD6T6W4_9AGAR|nr:hypothetical protein C8F04DRAFT_1178027 [Mycena alexandri]
MAVEQDCASLQAPLTASHVSDSPALSTPELTPSSSCASSADGSENSFFSGLSWNTLLDDTSLSGLVSNGTATPPPSPMLTYVQALVRTSQDLLLKMEANSSAQGVAQAFIDAESRLEAAFVAWCGVSASFFMGTDPAVCDRAFSTLGAANSLIAVPIRRRVTTWVQSRRNSLLKRHESTTSIHFNAFSRWLRLVISSSPSYVFVVRALDVAIGVAQKSDRAQGNAAFFYSSL